ncbi:YeeE/YedE thiosulfate transporter family protein [Roseibium aggregatum]|uniref:YeeE/YedE family protein n=1 Tax=Roseibium aggregatum TaxID=187304 RepID=A0A939EBE6_9HYPH|nr:YeeE/YedE thiosulfate transporter family protein [Roseibium aggregatum]MBN9670082.1 YeeE/YedE family protein [Roseibium aggregatum]
MTSSPRPFWPPLVAGAALGIALLISFLITGHGLGASGFVTRLSAQISGWLAPDLTTANAYFGPFLTAGAPLASWITWEVIGVLIGGYVGARTAGRSRLMVERGPQASVGQRFAFAFIGGALVGIGGRLARGCTSGLGLSGGATLAVAGFVFLAGFFIAGFVVSALVRRAWQ